MSDGIDVYTAYQTVTDWHAVRSSGKEFCYIKTGDGFTTRAVGNYPANGKAAGVKMGAYHFAQAGDPVRQANILCDQAERLGLLDLAPALDAEAPGTTSAAFCIAFLRQVKARGHRTCLYANNSVMQSVRVPALMAVPGTYIWVARYGAAPSVPYDVHQHSQTGHVPGIVQNTDLNRGVVPLNSSATAPVPVPITVSEDDMGSIAYDYQPTLDLKRWVPEKDGKGEPTGALVPEYELVTRLHTFTVPVGVESTVVAEAWISFKCAGAGTPGVAESVQLYSVRGDNQVGLPGGNYPDKTKLFTNLPPDHTRIYLKAAEGQDQFTAFVKSSKPYTLGIETKLK
jgi:GH25 family lysozyme M1 (1,4-beta-N-acetylmuramidase)